MAECGADRIKIKVDEQNIAFVNWIMQGYEHLGVVSAIDGKEGILLIRSTPELIEDVRVIVAKFGFPVEILADTQ